MNENLYFRRYDEMTEEALKRSDWYERRAKEASAMIALCAALALAMLLIDRLTLAIGMTFAAVLFSVAAMMTARLAYEQARRASSAVRALQQVLKGMEAEL